MSSISGFSRLKSLFSGSLNLRTYKSIVSTAQNAECGNLPKDLLSIFLSKGSIATEKAEIAAAKKAFECASETLSHGISVTQRAQSIRIHKDLTSSFDKESIISLDFLRKLNPQNFDQKSLVNTRGIGKASEELTERFSKIIPGCSKVEIRPLGAGSFGQGYKLEFLDADGNKIIHDKVLKVFYGEGQTVFDISKKVVPLLLEKQKEFSLRDIVRLVDNIKNITVEDVIAFLKPFEEQLSKQGIVLEPAKIEEGLKKLQALKLKDIKPALKLLKEAPSSTQGVEQIFGAMQRAHGVCAEANTMMYLRNRLGHNLRKTNVVVPDYYNLKKEYSIAEFSDELLPKSTSDVDWETLGLMHCDLHSANTVSGKIIDIGGVSLINPQLNDKITLRYYKKIMNQKNPELRQKYIERLQQEMKQMNELDREKVQRAINLAA